MNELDFGEIFIKLRKAHSELGLQEYQAIKKCIVGYLFRSGLNQPEVVEEAVCESCLKLLVELRKPGSCLTPEKLLPWLKRVAKTSYLDEVKKRQQSQMLTMDDFAHRDEISIFAMDLGHVLTREDFSTAERESLYLLLSGYCYAEIAELRHESRAAVYKRVARLYAKLAAGPLRAFLNS